MKVITFLMKGTQVLLYKPVL